MLWGAVSTPILSIFLFGPTHHLLQNAGGFAQEPRLFRPIQELVQRADLDTTVADFRIEDLPLQEALARLGERSSLTIAFSPTFIPDGLRVSCHCSGLSIARILDQLLQRTPLQYRQVGAHVLIEPRRPPPTLLDPADLPPPRLATPMERGVGSSSGPPDQRSTATGTLTGRVVDIQTSEPIPTAQVFIANSGLGSLTGPDGTYRLEDVPSGRHIIRVQRIGYQEASSFATVSGGVRAVEDFRLSREVLALDEVVVTGTPGGAQRRAVGNVVERLAAADIAERAQVGSVEVMLGARVPGLQTNHSSGQVGLDGGPIRIRGVSSMALANDPIVYVDGVRINSAVTSRGRSGATSRLNDINPADIESIEVIKGPAAATLYGTEASSGVIQIFTKRGITGGPVFELTGGLGANWFPDPRSTIPTGYDTDPDTGEIISAHLWDEWYRYTGERLFQRGLIQNYNLSVRGGAERLGYFGSINRGISEGFVAWNWDRRLSSRLGLSLFATDRLSMTVGGAYFSGATRSAGDNIWGTIVRQQISTIDHPMRRGFETLITAYRDGAEDLIEVERSTWNLEASYRPFGWLTSRLVTGVDMTKDQRTVLIYREEDAPSGHFGAAGLGEKTVNESNTRLSNIDLAATAAFGWGSVGSATSVGIQYYNKQVIEEALRGEEFATHPLTTIGAAARTTSTESYMENTTLGVYAQQQLDWQKRLFLTGALRADDNSTFGQRFDVAIYPKISATWVFSEEEFWGIDRVNTFRLRGAGAGAGQQPDVCASSRLYQPVLGPDDVAIVTMRSIGNPDLGPERGEELELGFDASLLDGRLDLTFTRYWKRTKDAIVPTAVTPSLGFPGVQMINVGEVSNWGAELSVNVQALASEALSWELGVAAATMYNRVESLGDVPFLVTGQALSRQYHVEGYPLAGLWAVRVLDAEFLEGDRGPVNLDTAVCDGGTIPSADGQLGGPMGGPPVPCSQAPLVYFGRAGDPTWSVSLASTLTLLSNWRLFTTIDARGGHRITDQVNLARLTTWGNALPGLLQDDAILMAQRTIDRRPIAQYNAGFAKLREVSLNYSLPTELANRFGASRAAVRFGLRNVLTLWQEQSTQDISGEKVIDPEVRGLSEEGPNEFGGHSHTQLPPMKSALLEFRASF